MTGFKKYITINNHSSVQLLAYTQSECNAHRELYSFAVLALYKISDDIINYAGYYLRVV
jgi:hypothetical protein